MDVHYNGSRITLNQKAIGILRNALKGHAKNLREVVRVFATMKFESQADYEAACKLFQDNASVAEHMDVLFALLANRVHPPVDPNAVVEVLLMQESPAQPKQEPELPVATERLLFVPVPELCRERLRLSGQPYARSHCAVCGGMSPRSRECLKLLEAEQQAGRKVK